MHKQDKGMDDRVWYEALALLANGTSHHHVFLVASSEEAQQRIRNHYPDAVTILVRRSWSAKVFHGPEGRRQRTSDKHTE